MRREVEREFWREVARGLLPEDAAAVAGVSPAAGTRWFRQGGGMPTIDLSPLTGRYLSFAEREELALLKAQGFGIREIAGRLGRSPSTISRELRRNAATRGGKLDYRASVAQWKAELVARRPKDAKLVMNDRLRQYVQERLDGTITRPDGTPAAAPAAQDWKGRRHGRRQDRRWSTAWSPEQVCGRLKIASPMMRACGSLTRRSTRRSTSRAVAGCAGSSPRRCGPDGRCGSRGLAPGAARAS